MASDLPRLPILDALRKGPLVIDGAMGTQLYERGVLFSSCFEELNISRPELVERVHSDYVNAGATIIETNTFGAHAMRLEKHNLHGQVRTINEAAVLIARRAAKDKAYVAGAIGPSGYFLGDALVEDLKKITVSIREQAEALCQAGVDALVIETVRQPIEMKTALEAMRSVTEGKVPIFASFSVDTEGKLADGTDAETAGKLLADWGADVIGVNCSDGPMNVLEAVERMLKAGLPVMAVPNAGIPRRMDDRLVYVSTPEYFGVFARRLFKLGIRAVGGCCGTTPDHVRRIAAAARMANATDRVEDDATGGSGSYESSFPVPESLLGSQILSADRSELRKNLGSKFVLSVEVNPPVGLDLAKQINAAKMLKDAGFDTVNIADGARAQARMGNIALAVRIQQEVGMETILHVCGRDRNLLGTLSHLLAAHELGIKNLVIITGDPPKMGDFPDASAVYDLDSIGILKMASRLNRGIDPSGKPLGGATRFVLASGAEPAALNYERELTRLREKRASGCELVMTQPVYDVDVLDRFLKDIEPLGLPVLVGLLPLASYKNAEFLHNEVPGMQVPERIRERMKKAGTGPDARREGVEIAREMLSAVKDRVQGAYIMPPLERYELAVEVVRGIVR